MGSDLKEGRSIIITIILMVGGYLKGLQIPCTNSTILFELTKLPDCSKLDSSNELMTQASKGKHVFQRLIPKIKILKLCQSFIHDK